MGQLRTAGPGETVGDTALLPREFGLRRQPEMAMAASKVTSYVESRASIENSIEHYQNRHPQRQLRKSMS